MFGVGLKTMQAFCCIAVSVVLLQAKIRTYVQQYKSRTYIKCYDKECVRACVRTTSYVEGLDDGTRRFPNSKVQYYVGWDAYAYVRTSTYVPEKKVILSIRNPYSGSAVFLCMYSRSTQR